MLGRGLGERIDAFPRVVRFNRYHLDGHEADAGTRTTVWAAGVWRGSLAVLRSQGIPPGSPGVEENWVATVAGRDARTAPGWSEFAAYAHGRVISATYPLLGLPMVRELKAAGCIASLRWPSTGLLMLAYCLTRWPDQVPAVCGYYGRGGAYANPAARTPGREHDYGLEQALIERWVSEGRVALL